jgi:IclR family acetate operon transcriptional repressor
MKTSEPRRTRGRPRQSEEAQAPVQALDRGLTVLSALAAHDGLTAAALGDETGLPASTIHRLLMTLQAHGFVSLDSDTARWRVGMRAFTVGLAFAQTRRLEALARPGMVHLRDMTGETVLLAARAEEAVTVTAVLPAPALVRVAIDPGAVLRPDQSAPGRALLAEDAAWAAAYAAEPRLQAALRNVHERGWALDDEESAPGLRGAAAAVRDHAGRCIAAIGVMGPVDRLAPPILPRIGRFVREAATTVSLALGYTPHGSFIED